MSRARRAPAEERRECPELRIDCENPYDVFRSEIDTESGAFTSSFQFFFWIGM